MNIRLIQFELELGKYEERKGKMNRVKREDRRKDERTLDIYHDSSLRSNGDCDRSGKEYGIPTGEFTRRLVN